MRADCGDYGKRTRMAKGRLILHAVDPAFSGAYITGCQSLFKGLGAPLQFPGAVKQKIAGSGVCNRCGIHGFSNIKLKLLFILYIMAGSGFTTGLQGSYTRHT